MLRAPATISIRSGWDSWRPERFTHTGNGAPRSASQRAAWRQASSSTHAPRGTISPLSSAAGMNSLGDTTPRRAWCHRTRASTPTMRPVASSTSGWNSNARSPSSIARRSPLWISSRSISRSRVEGSNSSQWFGPAALARAVAASASRSNAIAASAGGASA